jgi:lipid A disaccharide synthetase
MLEELATERKEKKTKCMHQYNNSEKGKATNLRYHQNMQLGKRRKNDLIQIEKEAKKIEKELESINTEKKKEKYKQDYQKLRIYLSGCFVIEKGAI